MHEIQDACARAHHGHGLIVRPRQGGLLSVLATLVSIELEPLRVCLAYELTPQPDDLWEATEQMEEEAPTPKSLRANGNGSAFPATPPRRPPTA